jgi:chloramphenicol O-acetyltransferase type A
MKHIIDIEHWARRDNYLFFQSFDSAWVTLTSEVDCTEAYNESKKNGTSFFVRYLYAVMKAVNSIENFRYRTDKHGNVCLYDKIDAVSPIDIKEEGKTFYTIRIPWIEDYKEFYRNTRQLIDNIPHDRDPYETDKEVTRVGDFDVINLSAVPGLYFTSVVYTKFGVGHAQDYPLMNVGKAIVRGDRRVMPISWTVSHEFIDGPHNARFMQLVQQFLEEKV